MSFPNRKSDASQPSATPAPKLAVVGDRAVVASTVREPVANEAPSSASDRVSAIDAMALCMSGGCVGG